MSAESTAAASSQRQSNPGAYAWVVVGLLFIVAMLNYLDRLSITTVREPIRADISMSDKQFALLTSVFLWVYAAVSPLGGFIADRAGRYIVIIVSLLFWSAATCLTGLAKTFPQILLARLLMGVSEACYIPAALALVTDYHRGPTRSLATGIHMTGIYLGAALGGVGAVIAEHFGWRYGFKLLGIVGMGYSLVLLLLLRDAKPEQTSSRAQLPRADLRSFLNWGFAALLIVNILFGVVNWSVYGWLPTYLRDRFRLGLGAAGMSATGYIQIASFAGVLIAGVAADRWSQSNQRARALVPAFGLLVGGPFLVAGASTSVLVLAILGLIVFGLGRGSLDANQMPLLREVIDERYSALGYGLLNLASTTAGGVMVYIGGALLDAHVGLERIFQAAGAGLFFAGILLLLVRPRAVHKELSSHATSPGNPSAHT